MKLSGVETFLTDPARDPVNGNNVKPFLFVHLQTSDGLSGWGEAFTPAHREHGIEEIILSLARQAMALDDINPRKFRSHIASGIEVHHPGLNYSCAVSAIEMALWDLPGKSLDAPVYQLLGGALTQQVPLYANTWSETDGDIAQLAERCQALVADGYRAVKIYPLKFGNATRGGECMRLIRETLGDDIDILLDLSAINNPALARDCAGEVAPYRPYWFEEPHSGEDLETLAEIRRHTGLRIVTGEKQAGKEHFRQVLERRAADVLNPDIAGCGGILEIIEIGAMAEAHSVSLSAHCWDSMTVALAAMLQVCAVMPNAEIAEIFPGYIAFGKTFARADFTLENGIATLGASPGLGIEIDRSALTAVADCRSI